MLDIKSQVPSNRVYVDKLSSVLDGYSVKYGVKVSGILVDALVEENIVIRIVKHPRDTGHNIFKIIVENNELQKKDYYVLMYSSHRVVANPRSVRADIDEIYDTRALLDIDLGI